MPTENKVFVSIDMNMRMWTTSYTVSNSVIVKLLFTRQLPATNVTLDDEFGFSLGFLFLPLEERKVLRLWLLMRKRQPLIIVGFVFRHAANLHYIKETSLQIMTCKAEYH